MSQPGTEPDWMPRAQQTLAVLKTNPALWASIRAEVDSFFHAHPAEADTAQTRDLMTIIVFRRLTETQSEAKTA
jgi:hypothetical protein